MSLRAEEAQDVVLRLLDHQIVGPDQQLLGNVDDLEVVGGGTQWSVTGIMVGPAALSGRLPGLLGEWVYAVWHRLHPAADPLPVVIPIEHVTSIDSAVHVDPAAAQALTSSFGLEWWLREHVVSRLPWATSGADDLTLSGSPSSPTQTGSGPQPPARVPLRGARGISSILGRDVLTPDGRRAGRVSELRCLGAPREGPQRALQVRWVIFTRHLAASQLGYSVDRRQGPWLVRRLVRAWQQHDRLVEVEHLAGLDAPDDNLTLRSSARARHPHDA
ncbi:hypothetical protein [Terrabacter sp. C0L_2]|jgi:hypothetical protein|uniref:hypothetical protein n=1 Tax=Terrabacter sp. C0L_2 TaxID=3108389 RepID=UPI002ED421D3|nr:hypothetical protein U5C87_17250 [Terrabacter sp. C0L_2]